MANLFRSGASRRLASVILMTCVVAISGLAFWPHPVQIPLSEDAQHILAFGVLTFLARQVWPSARLRVLACAMLALGGGIEAMQWGFTPRHAEWQDLVANAAGSAIAALISRALFRRRAEGV